MLPADKKQNHVSPGVILIMWTLRFLELTVLVTASGTLFLVLLFFDFWWFRDIFPFSPVDFSISGSC